MDLNGYALEVLAREHLAELRAISARHEQIRAALPRGRPLRVTLGLALIRLGTRTLGSTHRPLATRTS